MKDVSRKPKTLREAVASAFVSMRKETVSMVIEGKSPKGNPVEVARVAGVMAAKDTQRTIPFCHPVRVDFVSIDFEAKDDGVTATCTVKGVDRTGVEMEALCGASVAALTLFDMLKGVDDSLSISDISVVRKKGGKSDFLETFEKPLKGAVVVVSDSVAQKKRKDTAGQAIVRRLEEANVEVCSFTVVADEIDAIERELRMLLDQGVDIIFTTGGTGLGPRDVTVEAVRRIIEREVPGITEAMRSHGFERTPWAMLSRGIAGVKGNTLIVTLPGSSRGVEESLDAIWPSVLHIFPMMWGGGHPGNR